MRRRKLLIALAGLIFAIITLTILWSQRPAAPSPITRENFHCIREGMTLAEVEAILGPPGEHQTGEISPDATLDYEMLGEPGNAGRSEHWITDTAFVLIVFDASQRVSLRIFSVAKRSNDVTGNLWWRAERQWRKWFPE
jgi:hypothetical protein